MFPKHTCGFLLCFIPRMPSVKPNARSMAALTWTAYFRLKAKGPPTKMCSTISTGVGIFFRHFLWFYVLDWGFIQKRHTPWWCMLTAPTTLLCAKREADLKLEHWAKCQQTYVLLFGCDHSLPPLLSTMLNFCRIHQAIVMLPQILEQGSISNAWDQHLMYRCWTTTELHYFIFW